MNKIFAGNPSFPIAEPKKIDAGESTTDSEIVYCIDTFGQDVALGSGMKNQDGSASEWAGATVNGALYGRWTNVSSTSGTMACYILQTSNSGQ